VSSDFRTIYNRSYDCLASESLTVHLVHIGRCSPLQTCCIKCFGSRAAADLLHLLCARHITLTWIAGCEECFLVFQAAQFT
jgi:hypothetical protein